MQLIVALDDSGTHEDSVVTVLAGYLGSESGWATFEYDWDVLLRLNELPYFRSSDCAQGRGVFSEFDQEKRKHLHRAAVAQIAKASWYPSAFPTGGGLSSQSVMR